MLTKSTKCPQNKDIYSKKNKYANGIEFKNIIELIIEFIARIEEKSIV